MEREPPRSLVVDDEADMCWALENILSREGYQITTVTSGKEALELAREKPCCIPIWQAPRIMVILLQAQTSVRRWCEKGFRFVGKQALVGTCAV